MIRTTLVAAAFACLLVSTARAQNLLQWTHALDFASQQLQKTAESMPANVSPQVTGTDGKWSQVANTNQPGWTQGFFPGSLWYRYEQTGDVAWKELAAKWTNALAVQETNTATHDLGFKLFLSFGHGYELTGDE